MPQFNCSVFKQNVDFRNSQIKNSLKAAAHFAGADCAEAFLKAFVGSAFHVGESVRPELCHQGAFSFLFLERFLI